MESKVPSRKLPSTHSLVVVSNGAYEDQCTQVLRVSGVDCCALYNLVSHGRKPGLDFRRIGPILALPRRCMDISNCGQVRTLI